MQLAGKGAELADAGVAFPVILKAMSTILGKPGARFRLETPKDVFARGYEISRNAESQWQTASDNRA